MNKIGRFIIVFVFGVIVGFSIALFNRFDNILLFSVGFGIILGAIMLFFNPSDKQFEKLLEWFKWM
jgi:hypothetical protein